MTCTPAAFVNIDLLSLVVIISILATIGFFIGKRIFFRKIDPQKKAAINIYSVIFGLLFSVVVALAILLCLTIV